MNRKKGVYLLSLLFVVLVGGITELLIVSRLKFLALGWANVIVGLFGQAISFRTDYDPAEQKQVKKAILEIPSFGCTHYFKSGGCAMCGFNKEIEKYKFREFSPLAIILLVKLFTLYAEAKISQEESRIDVLIIFMGGSFINEEELPAKAGDIIVDFFIESDCKKLIIESRAEYVITRQTRLQQIVESAGKKKIEVAIGLESSNDKIRNKYIKKALTRHEYFEAVRIIKRVGAIVNTYVLIGSPFISRQEIVKSAIESVLFAWQAGSNVVSVETYCVQKGTAWADLFNAGKLKIPTLWDIIEVVKTINKVSPAWYLGKFSDRPEPIKVPENCLQCNAKVVNLLAAIRKNHDLREFGSLPDCKCKPTNRKGDLS